MSMTLESLQLQQTLIELYNRYAEGIDSKDWAMVRSCFDDRIALDYGPLSEAGADADGLWAADDWMLALQGVINGFDITRHAITNHRFDFSGDNCNCRAYLSADHVIFPDGGMPGPEDVWTVVGEYSNDFVRDAAGEWRIGRSRLSMQWNSGNPGLFEVARERAAAQASSKA